MSLKSHTRSQSKSNSKQQSFRYENPRMDVVARQTNLLSIIQRSLVDPRLLTQNDISHLQATIGNQAIQRLLNSLHIQKKNTTNQLPSRSEQNMDLRVGSSCTDCKDQVNLFPKEEFQTETKDSPKGGILLSNRQIMRQHIQLQGRNNFRQQVYAIRDSSIANSGQLVRDLIEFKRRVMQLRNSGEWTLVLAIHGSEDRVAAQAPPDWQQNAIFYDESAINRLFSNDPRWIRWRDSYGPNYLSLVSCQVSIGFERVFINNLTRNASGSGSQSPGTRQVAQGLGRGCKPITEYISVDGIRTRQQYNRSSSNERGRFLTQLRELNRKYGYYGAPPVADSQVLNYYFNEAPAGEWSTVEVGIDQRENGPTQKTGIPFWNRTFGPHRIRFRQICEQIGGLPERRAGVPPSLE